MDGVATDTETEGVFTWKFAVVPLRWTGRFAESGGAGAGLRGAGGGMWSAVSGRVMTGRCASACPAAWASQALYSWGMVCQGCLFGEERRVSVQHRPGRCR